MPLINRPFLGNQPIVSVFIGVSVPRQAAMQAAGVLIPQPVQANLLIDTGASHTCIDPAIVGPLSLQPRGTTSISTPSTGASGHQCSLYDVSLIIVGNGGPPFVIDAMPIIESSLQNQGIDGLLGRDVLQKCTLHYNGQLQLYTLAF